MICFCFHFNGTWLQIRRQEHQIFYFKAFRWAVMNSFVGSTVFELNKHCNFCNWSIPSLRLHLHLESGGLEESRVPASESELPSLKLGWCVFFTRLCEKRAMIPFSCPHSAAQIFNRWSEECHLATRCNFLCPEDKLWYPSVRTENVLRSQAIWLGFINTFEQIFRLQCEYKTSINLLNGDL